MFIRIVIASLLLINACFYLHKLFYVKRYRLNPVQQKEIKMKNLSYVIMNMLCLCLTYFL